MGGGSAPLSHLQAQFNQIFEAFACSDGGTFGVLTVPLEIVDCGAAIEGRKMLLGDVKVVVGGAS